MIQTSSKKPATACLGRSLNIKSQSVKDIEMNMQADKTALEQLEKLSFSTDQPILVCDADEVILRFAHALEDYLPSRGMYVNFSSYALFGNIRHAHNNEAVDPSAFTDLLDDFFHAAVDHMKVVETAPEHLDLLSEKCQILILTNLPNEYADRRRDALARQGISYPLIANKGLKGPIMREIASHTSQEVIFIDDIARNITSVAEYVPESFRLQYIAHRGLHEVEQKAEDCHHRCDDWQHIRTVIEDHVA